MAWDYEFGDGVDVDGDGIPRHPDRGHAVCGYPKTDAVDKNGRKRGGEGDGCLLSAGWGTDRQTGACTKHHGGSPGGPTGWANGNARHLLYSERMDDDDAEIFEAVVRHPEDDDELLRLEDAADMLRNMIGWEQTRLVRAVEESPDVERVDTYRCPRCGTKYKGSESSPAPDQCTGSIQVSQGVYEPCPSTRGDFEPTGKSFVDTADKALERKESHIANLVLSLKQVADVADLTVDGDHTVRGDADEPVEVEINHVGVDLPDDVDEPEPVDEDDGGDE